MLVVLLLVLMTHFLSSLDPSKKLVREVFFSGQFTLNM